MATTAIWDVRGWLGQVVHYVENTAKTKNPNFTDVDIQGLRDVMNYATQDYKTEQQFYVSGINCMAETARQEMLMVKKQFGKDGGIVAFHGYQSFAPGEVTPDLAHELGMKLAQKLWGARFQVIVATHLDKLHIHSHFVLNSVSFLDGKRYNDCNATYDLMRRASDRLCQEYGLSIIDNPKPGKRHSYDAWQAERDGKPTWWSLIREDVDKAIRQSISMSGFMRQLRSFGYEIKTGKYISIRPQGKERFTRLKTLGDNYTEEAIKQRILRQRLPEHILKPIQPTVKYARFEGNFKLLKPSIKGLRALYFHYLYLLRKAQRQPTQYVSFLLREDIRKMDAFTAQTKLLCKYRIETKEELLDLITDHKWEKVQLTGERRLINNRKRRTTDEIRLTECRVPSDKITNRLSVILRELKAANAVLNRFFVLLHVLTFVYGSYIMYSTLHFCADM